MILLPSLVGMGDSRNIVELYDRLSISSSIHAMRTFLDVVIFRFSFFDDFAFREQLVTLINVVSWYAFRSFMILLFDICSLNFAVRSV